MKLNKTQRDYAVTRLNDKIREKRDAEMPELIHSKKDSKDGLYDLLTNAGIKLVSRDKFRDIWGVNYIGEAIIYPADFDKEHEDNLKERNKVIDKYELLKQQILDKLYLCDEAEEALALINSI